MATTEPGMGGDGGNKVMEEKEKLFCRIFLPLAWSGHIGLGLALGENIRLQLKLALSFNIMNCLFAGIFGPTQPYLARNVGVRCVICKELLKRISPGYRTPTDHFRVIPCKWDFWWLAPVVYFESYIQSDFESGALKFSLGYIHI